MSKYHGKKGVVYISTSGSGTATTIVGLNKWSLNGTTDTVETTEFGAANKTYAQGFSDVSGTLSGFWDSTDDNLYDASRSSDGVKLYLYPSSDATTKYWYGPAWVDFSIDTGTGQAVTVSGNYKANGNWGQL